MAVALHANTKRTIARHVARGAAWLDEHAGLGWHNLVDLTRLRQFSGDSCVLAQVLGDPLEDIFYFDVCYKHEITEKMGYQLGFQAPDSVLSKQWDAYYEAMDEAWKDLIEARRAQGATS